VERVKVDGIDHAQLNKLYDYAQKTVQEGQKHDPKQKQQQRVLNKDQQVSIWDKSNIEDLEESIEKLNSTAEAFNVSLKFSVDDRTDRIVVKVIERKTERVIREIPPEQVLNMVAQIQDLIGVFVDSRR
jgi:flagellar protein FlaG